MNESMLDRLVSMENRYEELGHMLMDPDIGTDIKKMTDVTKEQASLQAAYDLFQEYKEVKDGIDGYKMGDKEIYNPWSILNYVRRKVLVPYWVNTSANTMLKQAI